MARVTARQVYESQVGGLLEHVWQREGDTLLFNPIDLNTPLCEVIQGESTVARATVDDLPADQRGLADMDREELMGQVLEMQEQRDEARQQTLHALLNFLFGDGPKPLQVSERAFILGRALSQAHVWNMKQWEAGAAHGLIKQTWQEMEKRLIEDLAARLATNGVFTQSGGKNHAARLRYSADKQGNTSRRCGKKRGDDRP